MLKRLIVIGLAIALACAGTAWAMDPVNNDLDATATSKTWTMPADADAPYGYKSVGWTNPGTNTVYICPWRHGETVIPCTVDIGRPVLAGQFRAWYAETTSRNPVPRPVPRARRFGFKAVTYICAATKTSDNNTAEAWDPF